MSKRKPKKKGVISFGIQNLKRNNFKIGVSKQFKLKVPVYLTSHSRPHKLRKFVASKKRLNRMDKSFVIPSLMIGKPKHISKKNLTWPQAKRRYPLMNPYGDTDKDGVKNIFDCRPFDRGRQHISREEKILYDREWYRKNIEEVRRKQKIYQSIPEVAARKKERDKEWKQIPEVKARMKEEYRIYSQTPEVKARRARLKALRTPEQVEINKDRAREAVRLRRSSEEFKQSQIELKKEKYKQTFEGRDVEKEFEVAQEKVRHKLKFEKQLRNPYQIKSPRVKKRMFTTEDWENIVRPAMLRKKGFKCEEGGEGGKESPLHVHHLKYPTEEQPTRTEDLKVLCDKHHKEEDMRKLKEEEMVDVNGDNTENGKELYDKAIEGTLEPEDIAEHELKSFRKDYGIHDSDDKTLDYEEEQKEEEENDE